MAKIFGGSASRLEVYALFAAAVVLIGGGVAGAVVVTSSDSKPAELALVETTTTSAPATPPVQVEAGVTTLPPAQTSRQVNPPATTYEDPTPITVTPSQPIQDFSAYCTMPNILGYFALPPINSGIPIQGVAEALTQAGCLENWAGALSPSWGDSCLEAQMPSNYVIRVIEQSPSAGTLVHKSFGRIVLRVALNPNGYDLSTPIGRPPFC